MKHITTIAVLVLTLLTGKAWSSPGNEPIKTNDNLQTSTNPLPITVKIWYYHSGERAEWVDQGHDEWQGQNFWCIADGKACEKWDWLAIYPVAPSADPCPQNNNSQYGDGLMRATAAAQSITLPANLPMPDFQLSGSEQ